MQNFKFKSGWMDAESAALGGLLKLNEVYEVFMDEWNTTRKAFPDPINYCFWFNDCNHPLQNMYCSIFGLKIVL